MKRGRVRGRRSVALQHRMVWQGCALLLVRPDDRFTTRLEGVEEMLGHLDSGYAMALGRATAGLRNLDTRTARHTYGQTFGERRSLMLTHWLAEDNRERVVHRQQFVDAYRAAGGSPPSGAMPDHLAAVLEFAAHVDPGAGLRLLTEHRVQIAALQRALGAVGSPYAHAVAAVCATLPAVGAEELQRAPTSGSFTEALGPQHVHVDLPPN